VIWFTSDTHFNHHAMVGRRGFSSVEEMNEALIAKWNARVKGKDTAYVLGDFAFSKAPELYFDRLAGWKHLVAGNHDDKRTLRLPWASVQSYLEVKDNHELFVLSHYAFAVWNKSHYGSLHLHGHSHGSLPDNGLRRLDVGVDPNDLAPVSLDAVRAVLRARPVRAVDYHEPRSGATP
jgi:calcineurin-like phosphoesterase family protein